MKQSRRDFLKTAVGAAAAVAITAKKAEASFTEVLVHPTTWGTDDFWKFKTYTGTGGTGTLISTVTKDYTYMQAHYDASINKYRVPLSDVCTNPSACNSAVTQHINFTVGRSELTIEILD